MCLQVLNHSRLGLCLLELFDLYSFILFVFMCFACLFISYSLCSPGQPGTHYHVAHAGVKLTSVAVSDVHSVTASNLPCTGMGRDPPSDLS